LNKAISLRPDLAHCYTQRASLYISMEKWAEAGADYARVGSLPAREGGETTRGYAAILADFMAQKFNEGLARCERLAATYREDSSWLYDLACALAIGAEVAGKTQGAAPDGVYGRLKLRALELLELSVAQGYNEFYHLRQDNDFISLRGEPRFQALARTKLKPTPN
jgi:hypothetical protein